MANGILIYTRRTWPIAYQKVLTGSAN